MALRKQVFRRPRVYVNKPHRYERTTAIIWPRWFAVTQRHSANSYRTTQSRSCGQELSQGSGYVGLQSLHSSQHWYIRCVACAHHFTTTHRFGSLLLSHPLAFLYFPRNSPFAIYVAGPDFIAIGSRYFVNIMSSAQVSMFLDESERRTHVNLFLVFKQR